ncbi:MAG TPA: CoA ester lyase, partial [Methylophilus sp.]|nr:CoA ester lyase [Methylophilus sp.]
VVNDKLVEHHHIKAAQRLIQLAEAIAELEEEFI